jgi:hypothetical protein
MCTGHGIDQLPGNADRLASLANRAFENIPDARQPSGAGYPYPPVLVDAVDAPDANNVELCGLALGLTEWSTNNETDRSPAVDAAPRLVDDTRPATATAHVETERRLRWRADHLIGVVDRDDVAVVAVFDNRKGLRTPERWPSGQPD